MCQFLRLLAILQFSTFLVGCKTVDIQDVGVINITDDTVFIRLVTSEDLSLLKRPADSQYINLEYQTSNTKNTSEFESPGLPEEYPFVVSGKNSEPCQLEKYCTIWMIPMESFISWALYSYEYKLSPGDSIKLRLSGGSIGCCSQESNTVTVELTEP